MSAEWVVASSDHPSNCAVPPRLHLLGLNVDLSGRYGLAHRDRRLAELAERFRGLKPPQFPTVFEALVNGFACQQLSLVVGLELLNRLAAVCDVTRRADERARYAFPAPHDVARVSPTKYHAIGFSRRTRPSIAQRPAIHEGTSLPPHR